MDLNAIMSNIYGEGSSQNFDSLGFTGGNVKRHAASIRYLDDNSEKENVEQSIVQSYKATKIFDNFHDITMSGGGKEDKIYPSAEYIDNSDLQKFIKEFYLHYLVINAHKNMILIVPSPSTLSKLISEFKAALDKEKIEQCSPNASRFAAKADLPFKNYIFDVYGRSSQNNDGYLYQVPIDFASKGGKEIYRRTNRSSKQYFFKFEGASKISIADNEKFANANNLKLLGCCDRAVIVLQGDVPPSSQSKSKVVSASMGGGAKRNVLRSCFRKCVRRNASLDDAAYEFVARVAKASGVAKVAKYYSGDFAHAAFSILAASEESEESFGFDDSEECNIEQQHSAIIDNYKPLKSVVKMDKVQAVLPKLLRDATTRASDGNSANRLFISNLRKMYGAIKAPKYMLPADIACALTKDSESEENIENALAVMSEVEEAEDPQQGMGGGSVYAVSVKKHGAVQTPLIRSVYAALSATPFIGTVAREFTPLLLQPTLKRSAFEDHNSEILEGEDDKPLASLGDDDCKDGNCGRSNDGKNDQLDAADFDIKAFF